MESFDGAGGGRALEELPTFTDLPNIWPCLDGCLFFLIKHCCGDAGIRTELQNKWNMMGSLCVYEMKPEGDHGEEVLYDIHPPVFHQHSFILVCQLHLFVMSHFFCWFESGPVGLLLQQGRSFYLTRRSREFSFPALVEELLLFSPLLMLSAGFKTLITKQQTPAPWVKQPNPWWT